MTHAEIIWTNLETVRKQAPLVHNITNYVVMNNTANALLALGASPVMAHANEEVEDMTAIANSLVINIGTLSPHWVKAMEKAIKKASFRNLPIVIDPVGAGATAYRTETVKKLLDTAPPDVIRGNASEISALHSAESVTKGVDSTQESHSALESAKFLSDKYDCIVVVSGEIDYIISSGNRITIHNGHALMAKVTGMGCTASSLIGAFAGVNNRTEEAAMAAMAMMGIAGEMAAEKAAGPGTMQLHFLDTLYQLEKNDIEKLLNMKTEGIHV